MEYPNIADGDPVTHEVQVDLHMLRPLMLDGVGGEVHGADVVAVDERALGERAVELRQELSEPGRLRHAVSDSPVLRLGTGAGDNRLPLGRPGDKVSAQEDGVAGSGEASVRAASPVSVGVDHQLRGGRAVKNKAETNSATNVAEETLQCSKVRLPGIMHVKTDLLNGICEIQPGEGQVLQGAGKAPVGSRISHGITQISRQLRLSIDRSGAWLAIS